MSALALRYLASLLAVLFSLSIGSASAHGDAGSGRAAPVVKEQKAWGIVGDPRAVKRTIEIRMTDDMRFIPERIEIKQGETIRLVAKNGGRQMHELVLGTRQELDEHAAAMLRFPNMQHEEPYMVHVAPGQAGTIVWNFNRAGEFDFACLIAGHYQAGMVGKIKVVAK